MVSEREPEGLSFGWRQSLGPGWRERAARLLGVESLHAVHRGINQSPKAVTDRGIEPVKALKDGAATGTPDRAQAADSLKAFLSVSILVVVTSKKAVDSADNG